MKKLLIAANLLTLNSFADDGLREVYNLSNASMDIVTHTKEFPSEGRFNLTTEETDLALSVGKNDYYIGEYVSEAKNPLWQKIDCRETQNIPTETEKNYRERDFRVGAFSINSLSDFERSEQFKYSNNEYATVMNEKGYSVSSNSKYNWDNLIKRFKEYDPKENAGVNSEKLAAFIKKETGLDVPKGTLASEFMYRDLLKNPESWKDTLEKSKDALSFDEKIKLVAKLGNKFNDDYNHNRTVQGSSDSQGIVSTETLLRNLSTSDAGGVCRDVSLSQSQMLKSLGVKESYSIAYSSNRGGHATLIVVDPNDKNRIIKLNYGDVRTDDGKKGSAAMDQDNSLPNVGMRYRVYDNEGKPLASIPTELGSIFKEVTGQDKDPSLAGRSYSLHKAYFGTDQVQGSLFNGKTSTGETVNGVAFHSKVSFNEHFDVKGGAAAYNAKADKTYYDIDQTGVYAYLSPELKTTIYDGNYGKFGTGVGGSIEVQMVNAKSKSKVYNEEFSEKISDVQYGVYSRSTYQTDITDKDRISFSGQVNGRVDKNNVADEGKKSLHYDSTVFISSYEHAFNENLASSLEVSNKLSKYGNNTSFKASLQENANRYTIGGTIASKDSPSFLSGQNTVYAGYERATKNEWYFKLEYEKNLDSDNQQVNFKATKRF